MDLFTWTPTECGALFILLAFSILIDPYVGYMTDLKGPRVISVFGLSLGTVIWLAFCTVTKNSTTDRIILSVPLFLLGFSIGCIQTPNMVEVSLAMEEMNQKSQHGFDTPKIMGRAYSLLNMSYGIGSVLGPFWGGFVIKSCGWSVLCLSFVALNALGACLALRFSGGPAEKR